ncbi:MAG: DUF4268 domain-containing protein [Candidatus Gastranaerophilaceae bacterium]|nr:DUF4268 domain-containing protein [Candidatus Gastranaerophilaceae bacterium]
MTTITAEQALKSKQNFSEFLENNTPVQVTSTIADYQAKSGKVVVTLTDLTQNFDTFVDVVNDPTVLELPQKPYFAWIVTNPKERIMNVLRTINECSTGDLGIFVFKAFLNGEKIDFECLLKPELKEKHKKARTITKTGETQYDYWKEYSEVCDEMGEGDFQVEPASRHYQNIPIGVKGAYIKQTISIKDNYVASEIFIGNDKELYAKLESNKKELEKELGTMTWQCLDSNKSCNIRRVIYIDFTNPERYQEMAKAHIELAVKMKKAFLKYL